MRVFIKDTVPQPGLPGKDSYLEGQVLAREVIFWILDIPKPFNLPKQMIILEKGNFAMIWSKEKGLLSRCYSHAELGPDRELYRLVAADGIMVPMTGLGC